MTIFFTSDHHFWHARIIELCNRPFKENKKDKKSAIEVMNESLIARWNDRVQPTDKVYHLGDFAMGDVDRVPAIVSQLNGDITFVGGNHDRNFSLGKRSRGMEPDEWNDAYKEMGFNDVVNTNLALAGFEGLEPVMLSHYPYEGDHFDADRFDSIRAVDSGLPIIHGHTHSKNVVSYSSKGTLQIHIGVDAWDFYPVSYERITEIIQALDTTRMT